MTTPSPPSPARALQIIDSSTGVVTVGDTTALDYDTATSCTVTIKATSADGSHASQTFTLTLTDVDESDVTTPTDSDATANTVAENIANGQTVGITALATDNDGSDTVSYAIHTQSCSARFRSATAPPASSPPNTNALDREAGETCTVTIRNQHRRLHGRPDLHAHPDRRRRGRHRRDQLPDATDTVAENAADNTAAGITASATDADATDDTTYSMVIDTVACDGYFDIGSSDGTRVDGTNEMDYESVQTCTVTVTSTSDDGSTSTKELQIALTDSTSPTSPPRPTPTRRPTPRPRTSPTDRPSGSPPRPATPMAPPTP